MICASKRHALLNINNIFLRHFAIDHQFVPKTQMSQQKSGNVWDNRYEANAHAYGLNPNSFIKEFIESTVKTGTVIIPGDGEGRNSLFCAQKGWIVDSFDYSQIAVDHSNDLFEKHGVSVNCFQADATKFKSEKKFDVAAVTYLHLPLEDMKAMFDNTITALNEGGSLVCEMFAKEQRTEGYTSGGPPNVDWLCDLEFFDSLEGLDVKYLEKKEVCLDEGKFHQGKAMFDNTITALNEGGSLVCEMFAKEQRTEGYTSGGPPNVDWLCDLEFFDSLEGLDVKYLEKKEVCLDEGKFHQGKAMVIRFIGEKI
eukprot:TRINITY_DN2269_c0_g1_i1.p1 TRINITY_DN2269_c0_g1~~TRINITY_DN2269_c0_g1_i1.p1  ORF type:complete len:311 (+),score=54.92 TRINITY_DN2269_c0_g1_i1:34-966(+)